MGWPGQPDGSTRLPNPPGGMHMPPFAPAQGGPANAQLFQAALAQVANGANITSKISKRASAKFSQILGGLVLGCIEAEFCK